MTSSCRRDAVCISSVISASLCWEGRILESPEKAELPSEEGPVRELVFGESGFVSDSMLGGGYWRTDCGQARRRVSAWRLWNLCSCPGHEQHEQWSHMFALALRIVFRDSIEDRMPGPKQLSNILVQKLQLPANDSQWINTYATGGRFVGERVGKEILSCGNSG